MSGLVDRQSPTKLSELTPEWLNGVLKSSGHIGPDDTVTGWHASPVGVGIGLLSDIARLELEYADGRGPVPSLIAKFAASDDTNRAVGLQMLMYEREVRFYQDLAPTVGDCCPVAFYSDIDASTGDMVLLLEDLCSYRPGDQTLGLSLADAELGIAEVARLHAVTWHAERREDLSWWPRTEGPVYLNGLGGTAAAIFDQTVERFAPFVSPEVVDAAERYKAAIPELHRRMGQGPQALIHGDFRVDNFMFGVSEHHRPFVMLDLQAPLVTKSVHDLAYLLTQSMPVDVRRANERRLVSQYHSALVDLGVNDYADEQCWEDYRTATLHVLEYAIMIAGGLEPGNERGLRFAQSILQRSSQAIVDLDLLSLLP